MSNYLVAALYKFVRLPDYEALQAPIAEICNENNVKGTLLLAAEGINGTIAGPEAGLRKVLAYLGNIPAFKGLVHKESWAEKEPFLRMKVRLKKEIVTMGVEGIDPNKVVGTYVKPEDWNALISDPDTILVDTRNDYEVAIGTFKGAVDPKTKSFREFPAWAEENKDLLKKPKIAMFCTGGIRCEKSTAYMKEQGYEEVYHLEGGILKYLEEIPEDKSLWEGDCFVFDERVSVRHGLEEGDYHMCRACRRPVSEEEMAMPEFVEGVSCPYCHEETTEEQKERFAERQRQIMLSKKRGEKHIGITRPRLEKADAEQAVKE
ncbi:rhodanese-related sulfurtransferase [Kordiimonas gwangyangensis]|uniref:oxygen-dependent tRNA uridine(34) hydroxylase TrhO n=1 Tax=Kordiimonas gwangyangensis TaxID=288022 RepID=UPI000360C254|nr:rhodanese-related sulfurtransferase [Kordiimonas gwangyangensis]